MNEAQCTVTPHFFDPVVWGVLFGSVFSILACFIGYIVARRLDQDATINHFRKVMGGAHKEIQNLKELVKDSNIEKNTFYSRYDQYRHQVLSTLMTLRHYIVNLPPVFGESENRMEVVQLIDSTHNTLANAIPPESQPAEETENGQTAAAA